MSKQRNKIKELICENCDSTTEDLDKKIQELFKKKDRVLTPTLKWKLLIIVDMCLKAGLSGNDVSWEKINNEIEGIESSNVDINELYAILEQSIQGRR